MKCATIWLGDGKEIDSYGKMKNRKSSINDGY